MAPPVLEPLQPDGSRTPVSVLTRLRRRSLVLVGAEAQALQRTGELAGAAAARRSSW